jgi:hypothetical protein
MLMKAKILIPLLALVALALPATAMAMQYAPTYTGNKYASKTQSGTCSARKVLTTAVLRCAGSGTVTVRYPFKLKAGCGPSVMASVVATGDSFTYGTRQGANGVIGVWVRLAGQARLTISTVTLRYYCN